MTDMETTGHDVHPDVVIRRIVEAYFMLGKATQAAQEALDGIEDKEARDNISDALDIAKWAFMGAVYKTIINKFDKE